MNKNIAGMIKYTSRPSDMPTQNAIADASGKLMNAMLENTKAVKLIITTNGTSKILVRV